MKFKSIYLTPQIVIGEGNLLFHCEWDNLNITTTNVHGSNTVNSAGGIMIQEIKPGFENINARRLPVMDKTQQRSLTIGTPEILSSLHFTRVGPQFPDDSSFKAPVKNDTVYGAKMLEYYVVFSRYTGRGGRQPVPGLRGFTSATKTAPARKSTIDQSNLHQSINL